MPNEVKHSSTFTLRVHCKRLECKANRLGFLKKEHYTTSVHTDGSAYHVTAYCCVCGKYVYHVPRAELDPSIPFSEVIPAKRKAAGPSMFE